jgi:hypothetical protein
MIAYCIANDHLLKAKESGFVHGIRGRGRWLTPRQVAWLRDIARSLPERGSAAA